MARKFSYGGVLVKLPVVGKGKGRESPIIGIVPDRKDNEQEFRIRALRAVIDSGYAGELRDFQGKTPRQRKAAQLAEAARLLDKASTTIVDRKRGEHGTTLASGIESKTPGQLKTAGAKLSRGLPTMKVIRQRSGEAAVEGLAPNSRVVRARERAAAKAAKRSGSGARKVVRKPGAKKKTAKQILRNVPTPTVKRKRR